MEFEIDKSEFSEGLRLTQGVVERRNTLPILSHVLIEPSDKGISVLATDLDVGIRKICRATVKTPGPITVNARKLYEIVKEAPSEKIRVRSLENNWVEVSSGKSRFKLVALDPKEFPSVPGLGIKAPKSAPSFQATTSTLASMISSTLFAVSLDETRLNLSGVFVENHQSTLRMVATDGHRLAMIDRKVEGKLPEKGIILSRKGLGEVQKMLESPGGDDDPVTIVIDGSIVRATRADVELFMRLVEGDFPDYKQVIPKKGKVTIPLSRDDLLAALRRVSLLSTERAKGVRVTFTSGILEVQTSNPDLGEGLEEIEIEYRGEEISIGFNARYLIDALLIMREGERVEFSVSDDISPGVLQVEGDESYCYVVMPMRL